MGTLLKPYENASDRALIAETEKVESKLFADAFDAEEAVSKLDRDVGLPLPRIGLEEPKPRILGNGHTAAGTHFEVAAASSARNSCHHSATVSYTRPGAPETLILGGPNNPICLSSHEYRRPAMFCEAGIETIQAATPAATRSVRLMLRDGHAIESRVVRVPRADGGPAGIYAQELRGSASHAVSLVELDAGGGVVLSLKLSRYRCVKHEEKVEPLKITELASGHTPEGEEFAISTFGYFNGKPYLNVDSGIDPELEESATESGASKAFPWSISIGCAPHPYVILYGILALPGDSVVAQTSGGAVALNVVALAGRAGAKGPLVYGAFSALPSELTILAANGSTVYAEDLQAKAAEVTQFCEGYEEP